MSNSYWAGPANFNRCRSENASQKPDGYWKDVADSHASDCFGSKQKGIDGVQAARYTGAAATTIYLYNILLTLDLEVAYIWTGLSFQLPTVFYIFNRYICLGFFLVVMYDLAGFHDDTYCKSPVSYIGFMLAYTGWTGIMTLRVCALWRQRTQLVRFIRILWLCALCTTYVLMYFSYKEALETVYYDPYMRICIVTIDLRMFKIGPIISAAYDLLLTGLTILKAFDFVLPSLSTIPMLYRVMTRDGVVYFVISTTITVINLIGWYYLPDNHLYLLCSLYWAIVSTCLAQLVLNLKDAHYRSLREQLETEGVSAGVTFTYHTQAHSLLERGDPFSTGGQELGASSVEPTWKLSKAKLEGTRSPPSMPFAQTAAPVLVPITTDTPQRNDTDDDDTLRDSVYQ